MGDVDDPTALPSPKIDVSKALHEAGHETADLGFEDVPDTGDVTRPDDRGEDDADAVDDALEAGQFGVSRPTDGR